MRRKNVIAILAIAAGTVCAQSSDGSGALVKPAFAESNAVGQDASGEDDLTFELNEDEPDADEPLVLSGEGDPEKNADEPETLPDAVVQKSAESKETPVEPEEVVISEEEMKQLSSDPLFKDFATAVGDVAPLPESINLNDFTSAGAALLPNRIAQGSIRGTARETNVDGRRLLDESLALADINLETLALTPSQRVVLQKIDAEIQALCPIWIEAEVSRNVVGRRERDWRQNDPTRFSTAPGEIVDAEGYDWNLALDEPFFFKVYDPATSEIFFTKAGDFEQIDETGAVVLMREGRRYDLEIEPGTVAPTGRATRIKVLKNGQVQGTDDSGKLVVDVNLAKIPMYVFANPGRLDSKDGVFFTPTLFSGNPMPVKLPAHTKTGVSQWKLALSNGRPDEILARIVDLCKSKRRYLELLAQPRFNQDGDVVSLTLEEEPADPPAENAAARKLEPPFFPAGTTAQ